MQSNHPGSYARHTYRAGRMSTGQSYVSLPWQHRELYKLTAFRRCVVDPEEVTRFNKDMAALFRVVKKNSA